MGTAPIDQVAAAAEAGKKRVAENTNRWNASLETLSVQLCYAIIAANWAVHTDTDSILDNRAATWSLAIAVTFLALNVVLVGINTQIMWKRMYDVEHDPTWWTAEAKRKVGDASYSFPFPLSRRPSATACGGSG